MVSGIGRAPPNPIHWLTHGLASERENCLFKQVIAVFISRLKWISTIGSKITQINGGLAIATEGGSENIIG